MQQEWEIKLKAAGPVEADAVGGIVQSRGIEVTDAGHVEQRDDYLDTERLDLGRSGGGLRVRESADGRALTFKSRGKREAGAFRRAEIVVPWGGDGFPASARELAPEIQRHVEPLTFTRALRPLVSLETRRRRMLLRHPLSGARAELAIDSVEARRGPETGRFSEVEIESLEGDHEPWISLAKELGSRLPLDPSGENKLERAMQLGGREMPAPIKRTRLTPEMPIDDAAREIFRRHFRRLQAEEPGTRLAEDIEALHDMRVSSRRLRAAFKLLAGAFGPRQLDVHNRVMVRTGQALAHARDLDVFIDSLGDLKAHVPANLLGALEPFEHLLREHREREQRRLLAWLCSPQRLKAYERFELFLERRRRRRAGLAVELGQIAPGLVLSAARRVYRRGSKIHPQSEPEKLHRLRISMKKMRYAMEDLSDLYGRRLKGFVASCRELQDVLGAFNDADVAMNWVVDFVERRGRRLPRASILAVGSLTGVLATRREEAIGAFRKAWKRFDRDTVRRDLNDALIGRL